mmetsp:Transcript_8682/g.21357  ORF Transcript_8682/g.21357 Transcript_8682/m.21357 type:complete len:217 (+) Transcript_8682:195-845(+)
MLQARHDINVSSSMKREETDSSTSFTDSQVFVSYTEHVVPALARAKYRPAGDHLMEKTLYPILIRWIRVQPLLALSTETTPLSPPIARDLPFDPKVTDRTGNLLVNSLTGTKKLSKTLSVSNKVTDPFIRPQASAFEAQSWQDIQDSLCSISPTDSQFDSGDNKARIPSSKPTPSRSSFLLNAIDFMGDERMLLRMIVLLLTESTFKIPSSPPKAR